MLHRELHTVLLWAALAFTGGSDFTSACTTFSLKVFGLDDKLYGCHNYV